MRIFFLILLLLPGATLFSQAPAQQLSTAIKRLQEDAQFSHASVSLYVVDAKTGAVIFQKDPQLAMAPASAQKVITSVSAFELLGKDFTYKTKLSYHGTIAGTAMNGDIYFTGSGDPTLGSWRWKQTSEQVILDMIVQALNQKNINRVRGNFLPDITGWETQQTPRGWIWEDIGNYYGAGAGALNWRENQYDLILKPGKAVGDSVYIVATKPALKGAKLFSELKTGAAGSGDNAIIYLPENGIIGVVRGTVPLGNETFTIKGSFPHPAHQFMQTVHANLERNAVAIEGSVHSVESTNRKPASVMAGRMALLTLVSPSFDSMNYWFLKKSINLYGEAFVKTIAYQKKGFGATDSGLAIIRHFWSQRGIEKSALKIIDGSGLSPANRITTHALVTVMQYAKKQPWFSSFYNALPEMNGTRMKDGYISGVRSYTGYIKSKTGLEYTFAFIVNNFDGSAATVREKMWNILDILK